MSKSELQKQFQLRLEKPGLHINNNIIEHIGGPSSVYVLKPENKELPEFLLFGDVHFSYENTCDYNENKSYTISDGSFLDMFDIEGVHFFVEDNYSYLEGINYSFTPLSEIIHIARNCYTNKRNHGPCRFKFIKWHYTDIRSVIDNNFDVFDAEPEYNLPNYNLPNFQKDELLGKIGLFRNILDYIKKDIDSKVSIHYKYDKDLIEIQMKRQSILQKILIDLNRYFKSSKSIIDSIITNSPIIQKQESKSKLKLLDKITDFYTILENKLYVKFEKFISLHIGVEKFEGFKSFKTFLEVLKSKLDVFIIKTIIADSPLNTIRI
jgi:hypothetical protein